MADAEERRKKVPVRGGHRASATRVLGQVQPAITANPLDVPKITQLKRSLEEKLKVLVALDEEILAVTPEDDIQDEIVQADEIKDRIYDALSRLDHALNPTVRAGPPPAVMPDPTTAAPRGAPDPATMTADPTAGAKVKLPKISLPRFSGDPTKWTSFWDSYQSAIHSNTGLSEVDKFNYLRSLLDRTAFDSISGLTLSAANYDQAVEILCKRFGNKQVIVSKHMDHLLNLNPINSDRNLKDLRQLYDHTESHVRSLKSLGIEAASYGALLSPVLLSKLPPDLRLIVSRKVSDTDLDMDALLSTFEEELTARERANPNLSRRNPEKSSVLYSGSRPDSKTDPQCCYCQQPHAPSNCSSVKTPEARKQVLKTSGRCFNCLRRGHVSRECKSSFRCQKCKRKHHTSICDANLHPPAEAPIRPSNVGLNSGAPPFQPTPTMSTLCSTKRQTVFLQTARAVINCPHNPKASLEVRLLLDGGSQKSYISERACSLLGLHATDEQLLSISTFGSNRGSKKVCPIVDVGINLKGYPSMSLSLYVMPTICEPLVGQPISACVDQQPHLLGLELADFSDCDASMPIDVLIGADYYWQLVTGTISRGSDGPIAIHTKLGWVLSGPSSCNEASQCSTNLCVTYALHAESRTSAPCTLDEQLRAFWELEALGIQKQERTIYDDFMGTVRFEDGRYKVSLPWKDLHDPLPDNHQLCMKRLQGLLRRLRQDPVVLKEYNDIIQDQLSKGMIEMIEQPEEKPQKGTHYLPHHCVVRRDKSTTKVRVVYDASARSGSAPSLNDCLLKGPKFNQLIFDLLVRFRSYRIALTADLEKAFLMVAVEESDRDMLRFLWVDDVASDSPELMVYRFTRVVFGVCSSPFLLNATIRFHLEKFLESNESLIRLLLRSTYVDDIIAGAPTEDEAFEIYTESKEIFSKGGFNLRKFLTNSVHLQERINSQENPSTEQPDEPTYSEATLGTSQTPKNQEHKVLGVPWNPGTDQLNFDVADLVRLAIELHPTKRNIVSLIGKFFDPLGFLSPVIIRFKMLFQKLCQCKYDWDERIPDCLANEWNGLVADLKVATPMLLPRSYFSETADPVLTATLCGFCDASTRAYAAVVYLHLETETQGVVRFVAAKTRVAPLQGQTIPRLELLSALLLSRLITSVHCSLQHQIALLDMKCYTDSQVALYWIRGTNREWKPFVQNRVREIRQNVPPELWQHCPGISNPADLPSRGLSMSELSASQLWKAGPGWLMSDSLVQDIDLSQMPDSCSQELKSSNKKSHSLLAVDQQPTIGDLISCENFGDLQRLFRVTAYVLRAVNLFKAKRGPRSCSLPTLTPREIAAAELIWISHAQAKLVLQDDFVTLKSQLGLFVDDKGLWRCGGRLQNTNIPYSARHPVLLPRNHRFTALVVRDSHLYVCHNGVKETLTQVRRKYWIVKGRRIARAVVSRCVVCKKHEGAPFKGPPPPPLPEFRVKEAPAFTHTGVDFAGPLLVRSETKGSSKVWICVFTCLVTRAIHLDVVCDQSTTTFIRCLKRFAARRGLPRKFLSDNGKTFKATARLLKTVFKDENVQEHLADRGCQWIFNVERAPWWGGVFERMVRSTKRCLRKMIGRSHFTQDELLTAVVEIEAVINSRPLTCVSALDLEEPLTPSHLIVGRRLLSVPDHLGYICDPEDEDFEVNSTQLTRRMKHFASVLNHFWRRWRSEYLSELRESHRYTAKGKSLSPPVNEGDVVIVHDHTLPRGLWKLGRIQELYVGSDGQPRSALVRVSTRDRQHTSLKRPLQLLYPLEIRDPESHETPPKTTAGPAEPQAVEIVPDNPDPNHCQPIDKSRISQHRPVRAAAARANLKRRDWIQDLQGYD